MDIILPQFFLFFNAVFTPDIFTVTKRVEEIGNNTLAKPLTFKDPRTSRWKPQTWAQ